MRLYPRKNGPALSASGQRQVRLLMHGAVVALLTVLLIGFLSGEGFGADQDLPGYRFGPGDKLRIKVLDNPDISGEFTIMPSGAISLPSVGRIPAAGRAIDEFEGEIARRIAESGIRAPQVSLDVAEYRPVYVVGDVKTPGRYPFAAGLTVLQAIALGGGLLTLNDEALRLRLEMLRAREAAETTELDYLAAVAKRARLLAERDGLDEIQFPPILIEQRGDARVANTLDNESRLFATRRAAIRGEIAILEEQKSQSRDEMSFQESQLQSIDRMNELIESEKRDIGYLFGKGLATKTRLLELQRLQTDMQRNRLEVAAFLSRAREEINRVDLTIANLRNDRLDRIVADLTTVEQEISKIEVQRRNRAEVDALHGMMSMQPVLRPVPSGESYIITRDSGHGSADIRATDHSYVLPGDVVRVIRFEMQATPTALESLERNWASSVRTNAATMVGP